jgi:hypothetical protein
MSASADTGDILEKIAEQWQLALSLGTWWWNAAIDLWCPPRPQHTHHEVTVPAELEEHEPALFA